MENLSVLNSKERKHISKLLKEEFGFEKDLEYEFYMNTRNKIFAISKDISKIDLSQLRVNSLGLYFGEIYNDELRLSIEGSQIIGKGAQKNILKLDDEQSTRWMMGEDFEIESQLKGFVIVENAGDFLGCGKVVNSKLYNYVPKERRQFL